MPAFFLSYARADADDYFDKFHRDLLTELRVRLGKTTTEGLGFRDVADIPLGGTWRTELYEALRTSSTFIAMLSPTWVTREACHVEWSAFAWRVMQQGGAKPPSVLLPLFWYPVPNAELPPDIPDLESFHASLPKLYAEKGLRHLMQRNLPEYVELLTALADTVALRVKSNALPEAPQLPDIPGLSSIARPRLRPQPVATAGPKYVEFVIVAARRDQLDRVRNALDAYGAAADDWRPWFPQVERSIGPIVQLVAASSDLNSALVAASADLEQRLERARDNNTIALLVVDVWSLRVDEYREYMNRFDRRRLPNAAVLVVWNEDDGETSVHRNDLLVNLELSFPNLVVVPDVKAFYQRVVRPDELEAAVREALHEVRRRIIEFGRVARRATGPTLPQPRISGSGP